MGVLIENSLQRFRADDTVLIQLVLPLVDLDRRLCDFAVIVRRFIVVHKSEFHKPALQILDDPAFGADPDIFRCRFRGRDHDIHVRELSAARGDSQYRMGLRRCRRALLRVFTSGAGICRLGAAARVFRRCRLCSCRAAGRRPALAAGRKPCRYHKSSDHRC